MKQYKDELLAACLTFGLGEALLRLRGLPKRPKPILSLLDEAGQWVRTDEGISPYLLHDTEGGPTRLAFEFKPNLELRYDYPRAKLRPYLQPDGVVQARTNSQGRRGPEVPREKAPGTRRVVIIGDSNTFGQGVREQDTYVRRLETLLRKEPTNVEVINGGVSGYASGDCAAYLEERLLSHDPDVVVYGFYLNDVLGSSSLLELPEFREAARDYMQMLQPEEATGWRSLHWARAYRDMRVRRGFKELVRILYVSAFAEGAPHWEQCSDTILEMKRKTEARGGRFLLAVLPLLHDIGPSYPFLSCHSRIADWCSEHGVDSVDLLEHLNGYRQADLQVHVSDNHYNEVAHRETAQALADKLALLPGD